MTDQSALPLIKAPPAWQEAFRYFRLSRTSSDLYDSYRNMWLALESVLSTIQSQAATETEDAWLRGTLSTVHTNLDLNRYVVKPKADPVQAFLDEQYRGSRNPIFHAKSGKRPTLPGSMATRDALVGALARLQRLVEDAMRRYCSSQRQTRVVNVGPYHATIRQIAQKATLALLEDDVPADISSDAVMGLKRLDLRPSFDGSAASVSVEQSIIGRIPAYPSRQAVFRSLVLLTEGPVLTVDWLEQLSLAGIDEFEAHMVFGISGASESWRNYAL